MSAIFFALKGSPYATECKNFFMSEADTPWARLASRVTRVALTRKDVTYSSLVQALATDGTTDGERSIVSRISRGTLKLSLFLHIVSITGVRPPDRWTDSLRVRGDWDAKAGAVVLAELSRQPSVVMDDLVARLSKLGTTISVKTLDTQIRSGSLQLSLFVQLLYVLNSDSLERFVDQEDLAEAARSAAGQLRPDGCRVE
jgi:hypothetical protein